MTPSVRWLAARQRLAPVFVFAVVAGLLALVPFRTCIPRRVFGVPCPACGLTRASLRLFHGDFHGSFYLHPLAIPGAVGLCLAVVLAFALPPGHPGWARFESACLRVGAVALMAVWVLRLAGLLPPV